MQQTHKMYIQYTHIIICYIMLQAYEKNPEKSIKIFTTSCITISITYYITCMCMLVLPTSGTYVLRRWVSCDLMKGTLATILCHKHSK